MDLTSAYPAALDTVSPAVAANRAALALAAAKATQSELGVAPSGASSTVAARIASLTANAGGATIASIAAATDVALTVKGYASQSADLAQFVTSAGTKLSGVTSNGYLSVATGLTQTTVGAAGGASDLPASPTGYMKLDVNGTTRVVPFYAAS